MVLSTSVRSNLDFIPEFDVKSSPPTLKNHRLATFDNLSYTQFEFDETADKLGEGGNAVVYRATISYKDVTVALKKPFHEKTVSRDTIKKILEEGEKWATVDDHPYIATVFDWGQDGPPWIATEYLTGGTLEDRIGEMGPQQRLWTAYALTDAAAYASGQHGLVHHDLHPQNILFQTTSDGTWDVPKIVDWGLSRELIQHTGSVSQTTPKYAAPEQFDALMPQVSVGPHTDVYQLGVVCYELLTGHYPSHLHGDIPKASDRNPTLPEAIDDILTQALAHDRRHRYDHPIEVRNALKNILSTCGQSSTPTEPTQVDRQVSTDDKCESDDCRIVIVGVGGAGNNTVTRLYNIGVEGAKTVAINTDRHHLEKVEADRKVLIGKSLTSGLGADGDPSKGKRASEMAQGTIKNVLEGANLVFITAGMGRGTGTGVSPVVARIADDMGAMVVAMVTRPFEDKRARVKKANNGITNLREDADSVIISNNDKLLDYVPDLPIGKAFSVVDQIFAEALKCVSEAITQPSLVNLDYADMSTIMNQDGVTVMLVGETEDKNKTQEVVNDAMNPLLDVDYRGASGGLVHVTGGPDLTQRRARGIAQNITERLEADTNVIWGAQIQEEYKGKVRIVAIMTGV